VSMDDPFYKIAHKYLLSHKQSMDQLIILIPFHNDWEASQDGKNVPLCGMP
jgi:uncharacterized membrane protein YfhO